MLQDQFAKDGKAVPVVALRLIIDGNPQISYGIDDILQAILDEYYKDPLIPNITQCVILMRRCKFHEIGRRKQGQTVRIGDKFKDPDDLIKALDELIWYIAGNNLVLTDGKLGNYCIYNDILVVLDFDRKYALDIDQRLREYAVRYMAFMFAFAGKVYKDERLDDFRRKVLIKYDIALPIVNTTILSQVRTEVQLNGLYNAFKEDSRKMIKHYLAPGFADPVKHIFSSLILPLFTTLAPSAPSLPPAPSVAPPTLSTKKRSRVVIDDEEKAIEKKSLADQDEDDTNPANHLRDHLTDSSDFGYLEVPSANLGGRSRKQRKRKPKSKKTRKKRSLVYHNLTR
jgi:hypothetical protein